MIERFDVGPEGWLWHLHQLYSRLVSGCACSTGLLRGMVPHTSDLVSHAPEPGLLQLPPGTRCSSSSSPYSLSFDPSLIVIYHRAVKLLFEMIRSTAQRLYLHPPHQFVKGRLDLLRTSLDPALAIDKGIAQKAIIGRVIELIPSFLRSLSFDAQECLQGCLIKGPQNRPSL